MRKRSLAREHALKVLYQADITRRDVKAVLVHYWEETDVDDHVIQSFCTRISDGAWAHIVPIDEKISAYADNWQLKRMAVIDRNILRLGVYELLYMPDIPPKATINEMVELAKKYGDLESSKFVNGILDKIHKTEKFTKDG